MEKEITACAILRKIITACAILNIRIVADVSLTISETRRVREQKN
jgi:hypothetical protein